MWEQLKKLINNTNLGPYDKFMLLITAWRMARRTHLILELNTKYGKDPKAVDIKRVLK